MQTSLVTHNEKLHTVSQGVLFAIRSMHQGVGYMILLPGYAANWRRQRQLTPFAFGMISFLSTEALCQITLYMGDLVLQKSEPTSSSYSRRLSS